MCCRLILQPVPPTEALAVWLAIAGFSKHPDTVNYWTRDLTDEATTVRVRITENGLDLSLYPSVTNWQQHADKRLAASLMFQTAALIAERLGDAVVAQHATVEGCLKERSNVTVIAQYPHRPLLFENVCPGFRQILLPLQSPTPTPLPTPGPAPDPMDDPQPDVSCG